MQEVRFRAIGKILTDAVLQSAISTEVTGRVLDGKTLNDG